MFSNDVKDTMDYNIDEKKKWKLWTKEAWWGVREELVKPWVTSVIMVLGWLCQNVLTVVRTTIYKKMGRRTQVKTHKEKLIICEIISCFWYHGVELYWRGVWGRSPPQLDETIAFSVPFLKKKCPFWTSAPAPFFSFRRPCTLTSYFRTARKFG